MLQRMQKRRPTSVNNVSGSMAAASPSLTIPSLSSSFPHTSDKKRTRRQCSHPDCTKVDAGGGSCVAHGGGKKCSFPGCMKGYQTGGFCRRHGGGARCQVAGCGKVDAGRGMCRAHGGGKRCQIAGCPKADVGGGFCTFHGGGKRCSEPGCTKIDQGGGRCRAHGGARRCRRRNCQQPARGATGFCTEHGGSRVCSVFGCRRLVRSPNDTGTICATCLSSQKQTAVRSTQVESNENYAKSDRSNGSPRNSAIKTSENVGTSIRASCLPLSPAAANARCDGSQIANCLENGCARSFGGSCNCIAACSCNSPTSLSTPSMVSILTSTNTITSVASSPCQRIIANISDAELLLRTGSTSTTRATMMPRIVLQLKPYTRSMRVEEIVAMLAAMSRVRSVHLIPASSALSFSAKSASKSGTSAASNSSEGAPSLWRVIVRGDKLLDPDILLTRLKDLRVAEIDVIEQTTTAWTRKEVVLRVPDMMCPGNCGSSVLNAVRVVDGVEAARLCFEHRQIVIRGDMNVDALFEAIQDVGFNSEVDAETSLPRRFRFRVDDLSDVGLNGVKLKEALTAVEGVENLVLLTDRVEVLVVAMLLDPTPLVEAAARVGFEMIELSEEAWGIPVEVVLPPLVSSNQEVNTVGHEQGHTCNLRICPQNGCSRYMTTVAHTAALAVGWAVPGCGMYSGGECTCGDSCKCEGCPEHNPVS